MKDFSFTDSSSPPQNEFSHFILHPQTRLGVHAPPLFPSLFWLTPHCYLSNARVTVFKYPSQRPSLCLGFGGIEGGESEVDANLIDSFEGGEELLCEKTPNEPDEQSLFTLGNSLVGGTVFIGYPYCKEARVLSFWSSSHCVNEKGGGAVVLGVSEKRKFAKEVERMRKRLSQQAIFIKKIHSFVYVSVFSGM
jgi:hypothetical protein